MDDAIALDAGDVIVRPLDLPECDEGCGAPASMRVMLDLRNNGSTIHIGKFCDSCAEEFAAALRASLPVEINER